MKKQTLTLLLLLLTATTYSQQALWGGQNIVSPEIHPDKSVTFRYYAPNAKSLYVTGDFLAAQKVDSPFGKVDAPGSMEMTKNSEGVWEVTTKPLAPELYSYSFLVDNIKTTDPNNVYLIRDVASVTNVFLIDGGRADLYKVTNVAHGSVTRRWYDSPKLKMKRRVTVYTPAGYETSNKSYPVFYLLHGMGGDEEAWISLGRATQILDNLIAQGKAKPMILVMTNGNAVQEAAPGESSLGYYKPTFQLPKTMEGTMEASFPDVVKFIDSNYRTVKEKKGRAIAGLSMGGYHSLHISKQYPDLFDYVGLFSAAIFPDKKVSSPIYDQMEEKLKVQFAKHPQLYWIAIGNSDFLYQANVDFRKMLDKNGLKYSYYETSEGHIWKNWRIYLSEFAPMLFK